MSPLLLMVLLAPPAGASVLSRDAGVVVEKRSLDGGVGAAATGTPPTVSSQEVAELRRDVADLKTRTVTLEHQAAQANAMSEQLSKLSKQISELQTQLTENEARRVESERRAIEKRERSEQAISALGVAQQQLSTGSTSNVTSAITFAEGSFTGAALASLQSARAALANGDLGSARLWLTQAMIQAQSNR